MAQECSECKCTKELGRIFLLCGGLALLFSFVIYTLTSISSNKTNLNEISENYSRELTESTIESKKNERAIELLMEYFQLEEFNESGLRKIHKYNPNGLGFSVGK